MFTTSKQSKAKKNKENNPIYLGGNSGSPARKVADAFNVSTAYVYAVIKDTKKEKYKGPNPDRIRQAYDVCVDANMALVKAVQALVPIKSSQKKTA